MASINGTTYTMNVTFDANAGISTDIISATVTGGAVGQIPTVTAVNLTVDTAGTHATADIAIAGAAPPGARVVQITTPLRASSPAGTGGNVFTLQ